MSAPLDVSVVIPTYQRPQSLLRLLQGLAQQSHPPERFEVLAMLDGPQPETEAMLKEFRPAFALRWFVLPHRGETAARNEGLRQVRAETVVFLDDDVLPARELVAQHVRALEAEPGIVVTGSLAIDPASPEHFVGEVADFTVAVQERCLQPGYEPTHWDFLEGNFSARRRDLLAVGGWDEHFEDYGALDDLELGWRLRKAGFRFRHVPAARAYHSFNKPLAQLLADNRRIGRAQVYYLEKHPDRLQDSRLPGMFRGPLRKRFGVQVARYAPEWMFTLLAAWARRKVRWQPAFGRRFWRFVVVSLCGLFLARGVWDRRQSMDRLRSALLNSGEEPSRG
jgi:GT2 family glycosyltransferase